MTLAELVGHHFLINRRGAGLGSMLAKAMRFALLASGLIMSGCAEIAIPPAPAKYNLDTEPSATTDLFAVATYANRYAGFTRDIARDLKYHDVIFDGGILTGALAAVGALSFAAGGPQTRALAGAGLFAGGLTAWRGRLAPKQAAAMYEKTSRRMTCISNTVAPVGEVERRRIQIGTGSKGEVITGSFTQVLNLNFGALQSAQQAVLKALPQATDSAIRKRGEESLAAAAAQISIAKRLRDVLEGGALMASNAIINVETDLSSSLNAQSLDYSSLETSLINSTKDKAQSQLDANAANRAPGQQAANGGVGMAAATPDSIADGAIDALLAEIAKTKALTDSTGRAQDLSADLVTCRTVN